MHTIRNATTSDAGRLLEIYGWYVENTAVSFEYDVPTPEAFRWRIENTLRRYPYLVIEDGGRAMGYAYAGAFKGRAAYDWSCEVSVYVDRNARRQGFGKCLYGALEAALRDMGITNLYACIAVPETEDEYLTLDSVRFHARMGYREAGHYRQCAQKFGRWYDMVWMEKFIGEHRPNQPPVRWPV